MKRLWLTMFFGAQLWASPTLISGCGTVISQPGDYELAASLLCPNSTTPAIWVKNTKDVELRLKGRSISFLLKKLPFPFFLRGIGILVSDSRDIEIYGDGNLSFVSKAGTGILVRNSEEVKVEDLSLKNNRFGVSFQGAQSDDGKIEETLFAQNTCDVQVKLGAESPEIDDSNATVFCQ